MANDENYSFVNISVNDNSFPEAEKIFQVQLINPSNGAALGPGAVAEVTIQPSDGAFGVFQFADSSLNIYAQEEHDESFNVVRLQVIDC